MVARREEQLAALGTTDFSYKHDTAEDSTFQLVDSSKLQSRSKNSCLYVLYVRIVCILGTYRNVLIDE